MVTILYNGNAGGWSDYSELLPNALKQAGIKADFVNQAPDPSTVDYMLYAPNGPTQDLHPFTNLKLVQSLWAGVETVVTNPSLTQPLARMVERGMTQGMSEYVLGHVMRHHLGTPFFESAAKDQWDEMRAPPLTEDRVVGMLGLGALGMAAGEALAHNGFNVMGWSRNLKNHNQIECFAGAEDFETVLSTADIIVILMPSTAETENLINAQSIALMKKGAALINPARGPLIDDKALLDALDSGHLSGATLDVFRTEPLPSDDPYRSHPKVLVTHHIASATRSKTAVDTIVENIRRGENNEPFLHLVDRSAGY